MAMLQTRCVYSTTLAGTHLVGGNSYILEDEGAVEEEQVVGVWRESRAQCGAESRVGSNGEGSSNTCSDVELHPQNIFMTAI